ncbi:MAG: pilus assembly protein [Elusimicrobia bacterium]|nr:pilus assembly protein [Elusimicrobiota bacterium]
MTRRRAGQATTEVVLLFPMFVFFLLAFAKIFALLILVQKLEIASFYAARRWQLESHRNVAYEGQDQGALLTNINNNVMGYLGYNTPSVSTFLDLDQNCRSTSTCPATSPGVTVQRAQVWNVVTVTACTKPLTLPLYTSPGFVFCSTKYVPNRDRPIAFVLPGGSSH